MNNENVLQPLADLVRPRLSASNPLNDSLFVKYKDSVIILDRCKSVRDRKRCSSMRKPLKALSDKDLAFIIKSTRSLVKKQNFRIFQKYSCNRNPLFLSARKLDSPLADISVISILQVIDKPICTSQDCCLHDFFSCRILLAIGNIFCNRPAEQINLLLNDANRRS